MICDKKDCTGCFACYNICPKNAIEMNEDNCGYIYPVIDENKCVNCNLCGRVCPVLNPVDLVAPIKCYAGRTKDNDSLFKSSSGGIATTVSKIIINRGGIVYGASYMDDCSVAHIRVDNEQELEKLRGSKYVHSYIKDVFKKVKIDLDSNKEVLFIGSPCQVAGLRKYLMKDYNNLYLIDIICHGVPSQQYLKDEVKRLVKNIDGVDRISFRDKRFKNFTFSIEKQGKSIFSEKMPLSPYFYTFMKGITYRDNCYNCRYATSNRCSDMTIGDYWGLGEDSKFYSSKDRGVSVLLPITEKGNKIISLILNEVDLEERDVEEAINGNDQLRHPSPKKDIVNSFKDNYHNGDFEKTFKKVMPKEYYKVVLKKNFFVKCVLKCRSVLKNGKK